MRSLVLKSALAAILLSSSLGIAAAQGMPTPNVPTASPAPMHQQTSLRHGQRPRLALIRHELGRLDHRINVDSRKGYLTASERRIVREDWREIHSRATLTAERHGGAIPKARYVRLQGEIRDLGSLVHRLSNNGRVA